MSEEKQQEEIKGLSRREFLKDAGLIVGGATVGSMTFLSACGSTKTETVTKPGVTTTQTVSKFICPVDSQEFPTLEALKAHYASAHPDKSVANLVSLNINNTNYVMQVQPWWNLAFVLRDQLGLFGTKVGCEMGQCGSCTILADGVPTLSCLMLAIQCEGKKFTTIEGLSNGFKLSPLQQKFYDNEAFQCGYCTPGFIMASQGLLAANPKPTADDVREALSGHICVCQNFRKTVETVTGGI